MRKIMRLTLPVLALLVLPLIILGQTQLSTQVKNSAAIYRLRRPVALALVDGGNRLLVANRDSGTIAVVDTNKLQVIEEVRVGRKLSDMAVNSAGDLLLVTDEETGEVIWVAYRQSSLREMRRLAVGVSPVSVRISADGEYASVACLWQHRLRILDLAALANTGQESTAIVDLPFAPRRQLLVPGSAKVIVTDAFAGKIAVVDPRRKKIDSVRDLAVHNIRGLGLDIGGKGIWLTHQVLHAQGHTTGGDIRTGNLLTNNVRRLSLAALVDPVADVLSHEQLYFLGDVERGASDPAEVAETPGRLLVTLSGANELAIGLPAQGIWTRLAVGLRPTALAVDPVTERAYVANTLADSISVVDLRNAKVLAEVALGPPVELQPHERGELLFFDGRLSLDTWYSCHSCHTDGHTNGRLNDNLTDGSFGTPKRVLSLLGVKDTGPWAWNGRMGDLEAQVRTSITSTMQGPQPNADQVRDLTAFLQTLAPPPPLLQARGTIDAEIVKRGRMVFNRQKCATCHTPPTYTSPKVYDVGLRDEVGGTRFNPPSLRGLSQGGPYFHDNRAVSVEDVLTRHHHQLPDPLSERDLKDLLHFLGSL
ncbi:MAG TPA: cytochrome c peroxidase [Gemmataceae bacterium]|nr:cytochrome c peroxidase [Gemmataceae bacterium]